MSVADSLIWYVSFGSNMSAARFQCYVKGGRPVGSGEAQLGCRDSSDPRQWRAWSLPGQVMFAGCFTAWDPNGCGAACYRPDPAARSWGRAYLVTVGQFSDVVAQENGWRPGSVEREIVGALAAGRGSAVVGDGPYSLVMSCGAHGGVPAWTITCSDDVLRSGLNAPSVNYLNTMIVGLSETLGFSRVQARQYLGGLPGVGSF